MWKLKVISEGQIVAEHEDVEVNGTMLRNFSSMVSGYEALDKEGEVVELIGRNDTLHMPANFNRDENFVCIRGLWVHRGADVYGGACDDFGIRDEEGVFKPAWELEDGWNNPALQREWNLRPIIEGAGYAGTD